MLGFDLVTALQAASWGSASLLRSASGLKGPSRGFLTASLGGRVILSNDMVRAGMRR